MKSKLRFTSSNVRSTTVLTFTLVSLTIRHTGSQPMETHENNKPGKIFDVMRIRNKMRMKKITDANHTYDYVNVILMF